MGTRGYQLEIADIFTMYWESYCATHKVSVLCQKVVWAIRHCRTKSLGGHIEKCSNDACDYETNAYNSCRNRHCAKCEGSKRLTWVHARLKELLPIAYYHVTFTMPPLLHELARYNQAVIYDIFFKASSYTLQAFARDPKFLGAELGIVGILHTWGQLLAYHPHIHYIVTGGGLAYDKSRWKHLPYRKKFLFPVEAMSRTMRGAFVRLLKEAYDEGRLVFPERLSGLAKSDTFQSFCAALGTQTWYIHAKPPFSSPEKVVEYLSRYTHRVAIANSRLVKVEDDRVWFTYRDYKDDSKRKVTSLAAEVFIQRFLWHVLPEGFRKIRYYGFLSTASRTADVALIRAFLARCLEETEQGIREIVERIVRYTEHLCPKCHEGRLVYYYNTS